MMIISQNCGFVSGEVLPGIYPVTVICPSGKSSLYLNRRSNVAMAISIRNRLHFGMDYNLHIDYAEYFVYYGQKRGFL